MEILVPLFVHEEYGIFFFPFTIQFGVSSEFPMKYTHLDIAGAAGDVPEDATGSPVLALYAKFLNGSLSQLAQ